MSQGVKHDQGKIPLDLLSTDALNEMAKVLEYGSKKYSSHNWRNGFKWSRLYAAALRHLTTWNNPYESSLDKETNLSHLSHAAVNIMMLIEHEVRALGEDDRHKVMNKIIQDFHSKADNEDN